MSHLLVLTTMADAAAAERLAAAAVDAGLAACVNISPAVVSVYRWEGETRRETERQLFIKTTAARRDALMDFIRENHPYELPEIVAIPITAGLPGYLDWISAACEEEK